MMDGEGSENLQICVTSLMDDPCNKKNQNYFQEFRDVLSQVTSLKFVPALTYLNEMHNIILQESSASLRDVVVTQLESLLLKATSQLDSDQVSEDMATQRKSLLKTLKDRLLERFRQSQHDVVDQLLEAADFSMVHTVQCNAEIGTSFVLRH